jgi:tetratricopeptide (TPR) repeat protein
MLAFMQDCHAEAATDANRALEIAREIGARSLEAWALTNLGNALACLGRLSEAESAYEAAREIRSDLGEHHLVLGTLAGWIRAVFDHGEATRALQLVDEYLAYGADHFPEEAEFDPLGALACYDVLNQLQDPRAVQILTRGYESLQSQAARISDRGLRSSFLQNVPPNRRISELYEKVHNG